MTPSHEPRVRVNRPLDPSTIRAVGFDLDHTLAVYDDDRVNAVAASESLSTLADNCGYPRKIRDVAYDGTLTARGLLIDLERALVAKLDGDLRVLRARRAGAWLEDIDTAYPSAHIGWPRLHPIHSPFDLPTAFLFDAIARVLSDDDTAVDGRALCRDVRTELDRSHTRGTLKRTVMDDPAVFIHPLEGFASRIAALRDRGVRTFVLTNSEDAYAADVLDYLLPGSWRGLFDLAFAGARKPDFFTGSDTGTPVPHDGDGIEITVGGCADVLETHFGLSAGDILYVGDHAAYDVAAAAARGWRTVHVVPELVSPSDGLPWGDALEEAGRPTWFGALASSAADAAVASVLDVLDDGGRLFGGV